MPTRGIRACHRRWLGACLAGLLAVVCSRSVQAGAFLQKPGEGVIIVGGAFTDAVRAYDAIGRLVPVAPWRKFELTTYAEYGVTDWLTAIASPSLFVFRQAPPGPNQAATGVAEAGCTRARCSSGTRAFCRHRRSCGRLWQDNPRGRSSIPAALSKSIFVPRGAAASMYST